MLVKNLRKISLPDTARGAGSKMTSKFVKFFLGNLTQGRQGAELLEMFMI